MAGWNIDCYDKDNRAERLNWHLDTDDERTRTFQIVQHFRCKRSISFKVQYFRSMAIYIKEETWMGLAVSIGQLDTCLDRYYCTRETFPLLKCFLGSCVQVVCGYAHPVACGLPTLHVHTLASLVYENISTAKSPPSYSTYMYNMQQWARRTKLRNTWRWPV